MDDLWQTALHHLDKGNFSKLEEMVGGPENFDAQIIGWFDAGRFQDEPGAMAEAFACACMLGRSRVAEYLLDKEVDPYAGMKTGLSGFHYAASGGRLGVVELMIRRKVPMEVENMYGGTVLGQALWSAVNEHTSDHAAIIEALIDAGALIERGTLEWWKEQNVPSSETKRLVAEALTRAGAS